MGVCSLSAGGGWRGAYPEDLGEDRSIVFDEKG